VAQIPLSNDDLQQHAGVGGYFSRTGLLAFLAARQAVDMAEAGNLSDNRTGLISATTTGGMDRSEVFYRSYTSDNRKGRLRDVAGHDCGEGTERIARLLGIGGPLSTLNTACSSSANAILHGARMIRHGKLDRVLAGGADALTLFTLNGFNSLMILDREPCRPFDETRNGLNLGEGAGFVFLESEEQVVSSGKKVLAELKGYGNACDAFHQTASSPEGHGALLSMKAALESAGLDPMDIDYINAHGTGTKNNDLSEGVAIQKIFTAGVPAISSTKAYTGHTLGASGAIEAVICVLSLQNQCIFPNLRFTHPMQELNFAPVTDVKEKAGLKTIMSNSFGFGGNNTTLILAR
jgi:3-oxoacyl-[acyl-carrier-protein] synthase-1